MGSEKPSRRRKPAPLNPKREQRPLTEGLVPYLTGVTAEEVPGLMPAARAAKRVLQTVYPPLRRRHSSIPQSAGAQSTGRGSHEGAKIY